MTASRAVKEAAKTSGVSRRDLYERVITDD
jgi:hypothetical protein